MDRVLTLLQETLDAEGLTSEVARGPTSSGATVSASEPGTPWGL